MADRSLPTREHGSLEACCPGQFGAPTPNAGVTFIAQKNLTLIDLRGDEGEGTFDERYPGFGWRVKREPTEVENLDLITIEILQGNPGNHPGYSQTSDKFPEKSAESHNLQCNKRPHDHDQEPEDTDGSY